MSPMRSVWLGACAALLATGCRPKPDELAAAVEKRDAALVTKLLDRGADPNARGGNINWYVLSTAADWPRTRASISAIRSG